MSTGKRLHWNHTIHVKYVINANWSDNTVLLTGVLDYLMGGPICRFALLKCLLGWEYILWRISFNQNEGIFPGEFNLPPPSLSSPTLPCGYPCVCVPANYFEVLAILRNGLLFYLFIKHWFSVPPFTRKRKSLQRWQPSWREHLDVTYIILHLTFKLCFLSSLCLCQRVPCTNSCLNNMVADLPHLTAIYN